MTIGLTECTYCTGQIHLITPPQSKTDGTRCCSEICRKVYDGEVPESEWERLRNASVQKSAAQN